MKKVFERNTPDGIIEYFEDDQGNITTAKPLDGVIFRKWIVTDDPSQYSMGEVFDSEVEAVTYKHNFSDFKNLYIIELSYIKEDLPPQFIHIVNEDGSKLRIL